MALVSWLTHSQHRDLSKSFWAIMPAMRQASGTSTTWRWDAGIPYPGGAPCLPICWQWDGARAARCRYIARLAGKMPRNKVKGIIWLCAQDQLHDSLHARKELVRVCIALDISRIQGCRIATPLGHVGIILLCHARISGCESDSKLAKHCATVTKGHPVLLLEWLQHQVGRRNDGDHHIHFHGCLEIHYWESQWPLCIKGRLLPHATSSNGQDCTIRQSGAIQQRYFHVKVAEALALQEAGPFLSSSAKSA
mmetsp:Transcript_36635/g.67155  ORF Transcript_36635/g.67155 Transcript_36635/m.67155 type:complete len:251 (+) Transcript_36635:329-1081(+)